MRHDGGGENQMELDLVLSIGGSLTKSPETKPASTTVSDGDEVSGVTDAKEIRAVRRREAKRKREEKRQRRGRSFASAQENEQERDNPPLKKTKEQALGSECIVMENVDLNLYAYSPLQYVPFLNGYAFPCVVPYWPAAGEKTLHQPVACRSFGPFPANQDVADGGFSNGCQKSGSCGSPVCSSSVISDNYQSSSSHEGGGSSYTRRNSSNSSSDEHQMICPNPIPNDRASSDHVKPDPYGDNRTQCPEKFVESHVSKTSTTTIKKEPIASNKDEVVVPSSKPVFNSLKNTNMENGKPPKPQIQTGNIPSLQQMPCVSTTGVGPNGKTITGFLYKYSNLEVSILCVCHGESFSPAEFVKHAGGAEVSHPLRHITVLPTNGIPSAIR